MLKIRVTTRPNLLQIAKLHLHRLFVRNLRKSPDALGPAAMPRSIQASFLRVHSQFRRASLQESADLGKWRSRPDALSFGFSERALPRSPARFLTRLFVNYRGFCTASTSLSPFPLENTGLSIVPPMRKGNCSLPSFNAAPDSRATVLVKKLCLVVISANPR